jgi:ATP-dependent helicase Lhr and Lhr-like helicase
MLTRSVGASVILRNGELVAYLRRGNPNVQIFLPGDEPERSNAARDLGHFLATIAQEEIEHRDDRRGGLLISSINGHPAGLHFMARFLQDAGFHAAPTGFNLRRSLLPVTAADSLSTEAQ